MNATTAEILHESKKDTSCRERREAVRIALGTRVVFYPENGDSFSGKTVDISMKGFRCVAGFAPKDGPCAASLLFGDGSSIDECVEIIHEDERTRSGDSEDSGEICFGAKFVSLSSEGERKLRRFLMAEQRNEAARRRWAEDCGLGSRGSSGRGESMDTNAF